MKNKSKFVLRIGSLNREQKGFTLVELLIGIAIIGLVVGGITTTIFQIITNSARSNNYNTAVRQLQNAGMWLTEDIQMANDIIVGTPDFDGSLVTLIQHEYDSSGNYTGNCTVFYYLDTISGDIGNLVRQYNSSPDTIVAARYIDINSVAIEQPEEIESHFLITVDLTAKVGTGQQVATENRIFKIRQRSGSKY